MDIHAKQKFHSAVLKTVVLASSNAPFSCITLNHTLTELCSSHNLNGCKLILPAMTCDERVSQDHLLRGTLIIMSSMMQEGYSTLNDYTKRLMDSFFETICLKLEVLAEFLTLLIGNELFEECKKQFSDSWNRRNVLYVTVNVIEKISTSCTALLNYIDCIKKINRDGEIFTSQEALEMNLEQTRSSMLSIIRKEPGPFDFLIPRILDVLLHENLITEAIECLTTYKDLNKENLNAYIYIYKFMIHYGEAEPNFDEIVEECFDNIAEISPSCPFILEMLDFCEIEPLKVCKALMEFIDYCDNKENPKAWRKLSDCLEKLNVVDLDTILDHYKCIYSSYWPKYHWNKLENEEVNKELNLWKRKAQDIFNEQICTIVKTENIPWKSPVKKIKLEF